MSRVIAISNHKGGVGKTTTTISLGAALAEFGQKVLVVDFDPQGDLTKSCGININAPTYTVYDLIKQVAKIPTTKPVIKTQQAIIGVNAIGLDLLPNNLEMGALETELAKVIRREYVLKTVLDAVKNAYDFVLIDCAPNLGLGIINALTAADEVIIPLQTEYLAATGISSVLDQIGIMQESGLNSELKIAGVVFTMANLGTTISKEMVNGSREELGSLGVHAFQTLIKSSVKLKEAPMTGLSIIQYQPKGPAAQSYLNLARELMGVEPIVVGEEYAAAK